jgi:hypothetical protein
MDDPVGECGAAHAEERLRGLEQRCQAAEDRDRLATVRVDVRQGGGVPAVGADALVAGGTGQEDSR